MSTQNLDAARLDTFDSTSPLPYTQPSWQHGSCPLQIPDQRPSFWKAPKSASIHYAHDAATPSFNTFQNVDHALCHELMGAVEDSFMQVKHRPHRGYSRSITLDLLTHLYETYAVISNADWIANDKHFHKA